jgi:hypothetical protein
MWLSMGLSPNINNNNTLDNIIASHSAVPANHDSMGSTNVASIYRLHTSRLEEPFVGIIPIGDDTHQL